MADVNPNGINGGYRAIYEEMQPGNGGGAGQCTHANPGGHQQRGRPCSGDPMIHIF